MPPRKRLGQLLTELGVVDEHQLQSALGHQKQWGGKLGAILVQKGFCKEPEIVVALSKHLGMPSVTLAQTKIDPRAVKFVSKQIAEKLHVFPYEVTGSGRGEVVTIAMSDPTDLSAVDQLAFHTGKRIKPMLAGDSEIISAIHQHYGGAEEKKEPTDKMAQPGAKPGPPGSTPLTAPSAAKPAAAPPAAAGGSPWRVEPAPAGGAPRAGYVPPPIPPIPPPEPAQKLEESEPGEPMEPPAPPPKAEPLDLPPDEDDGSGQMMGLEPIAAHSQFGDQVAGQEEVAGEGTPADQVEGLVPAGVPHEGAAEAQAMEGLEPIAAHSQEPQPGGWDSQPGGWGEPSADSPQGWTDVAAPSEAVGWADEPAAPAAPAEAAPADPAQDWTTAEGAEGAGWGESSQEADWGGAAAAEAPGEQLPMDAIIGTAEGPGTWGSEPAVETPLEEPPPEQPAQEAFAAQPEAAPEMESAEAPDAWGAMEDPLAAQSAANDAPWSESAAPPAWGEMSSGEAAAENQAASAPAAEEPTAVGPDELAAQETAMQESAEEAAAAATDEFAAVTARHEFAAEEAAAADAEAAAQEPALQEPPAGEPAAAAAEETAAQEAAAQESPGEDFAAQEAAAQELPGEDFAAQESAAQESLGEDFAAQEAAAQELPGEDFAAQEAAAQESPDEDFAAQEAAAQELAPEDFAAQESPGEDFAAQEAAAQEPAPEDFGAQQYAAEESAAETPAVITDKFAAQGFAAQEEPAAGAASAAEETAGESVAAAEMPAGGMESPPEWGQVPAEPPAESPAEDTQEPPAETGPAFSEERSELHLEGWVAPPPDPEPQGAGWIGQALEATAPLSPADLMTLRGIGVDPNDGVAGLRLLATLVRVLHRRQLLEPEEVAAEIRESRAQGAASAAEQQNGAEAEGPVET